MSVLVRVHCVGVQEALAVAIDPTLTQDGDQKCCQLHPDVLHEAGIGPVYTRWRKYPGRVRIRVGERDRSDEMRSVMMRGRSPCLEFRGALGDTRVSDCWFRSAARAVATWDARTLSTATRLFTNSTDNCMANEITARTNQARKASEQRRPHVSKACVHRYTEDLLPLVVRQRSHDRPDGRHAGMALTAGGYFGVVLHPVV